MAQKPDTGLGLWFEGLTPLQMHMRVVAAQCYVRDDGTRYPGNSRWSPLWGIGKQWIEHARSRWGSLPEHELARRASILKKVDRIRKSTSLDPRIKAGRIGGLMASASRTPRAASERGSKAQHEHWLKLAQTQYPELPPAEQARKAKLLREIAAVRLQMAAAKARRAKQKRAGRDYAHSEAIIAKLRGRQAALSKSLRYGTPQSTEKARAAIVANLRAQATAEDLTRSPEAIEQRVKELRSEQARRAAAVRLGRAAPER